MPVLMIPDIKPPSAQAATAAFHVLKSLDEAAEFLRKCLQAC